MNLIENLRASTEWHGNPPASEAEIEELVANLTMPVPVTLLTLLRNFNGGKGGLEGPHFRVYLLSANEITQAEQDWEVQDHIPGAILFGTDQGDFGLLLDTRRRNLNGDCPVIMCPVSSLSIADSESLCDSLADLFDLPPDAVVR